MNRISKSLLMTDNRATTVSKPTNLPVIFRGTDNPVFDDKDESGEAPVRRTSKF